MTQIFNQSFPMLLPRHTSDLFEMFFKDTRDMLNNSVIKRSFSYPQNVFMKAFADGSSEIILQIALAGFTKDEISVSIENTNLSIEINPKEMTYEQEDKDKSEINDELRIREMIVYRVILSQIRHFTDNIDPRRKFTVKGIKHKLSELPHGSGAGCLDIHEIINILIKHALDLPELKPVNIFQVIYIILVEKQLKVHGCQIKRNISV